MLRNVTTDDRFLAKGLMLPLIQAPSRMDLRTKEIFTNLIMARLKHVRILWIATIGLQVICAALAYTVPIVEMIWKEKLTGQGEVIQSVAIASMTLGLATSVLARNYAKRISELERRALSLKDNMIEMEYNFQNGNDGHDKTDKVIDGNEIHRYARGVQASAPHDIELKEIGSQTCKQSVHTVQSLYPSDRLHQLS